MSNFYRDDRGHQKAKAEAAEQAARVKYQQFLKAQREAEAKAAKERALAEEYAKQEAALRPSAFRRFLDKITGQDRHRSLYDELGLTGYSPLRAPFAGSGFLEPKVWMAVLLVPAVILLVAGLMYYHAEYGLREGYVTDKTYTPAHWTYSTTTDSQGHSHTTSTYHPDAWSVTVTFNGESSSWDVSHQEYDAISYHQWVCIEGFGYRCQGEPHSLGEHTAEHYTVHGEEAHIR